MAVRQVFSAANGLVTVFVEYDDLTLAIIRFITKDATSKADAPVLQIKDGSQVNATISKATADVLPAKPAFMVKDPEDGGLVIPFEIGLNVPFGGDAVVSVSVG